MLLWALLFFVVSFGTGVLGFAGLVTGPVGVAQMLFFVFLIMTGITIASFLMTR